jgi:ankyrin repeat protein
VDWLLKHTNLKIGQKDKKGNNCVHMACMSGNIAMSRYLMEKLKGSRRLLVENYEGKTPWGLI